MTGVRPRPGHAALAILLALLVLLAGCSRGAEKATPENGLVPTSYEGNVSDTESGNLTTAVEAPDTRTKEGLRFSFRLQGAALEQGCARPSQAVRPRCLGLELRRAEIAARAADWIALPARAADYPDHVTRLTQSAAMLRDAVSDAQRLAALAAAESALRELERLLDNARP